MKLRDYCQKGNIYTNDYTNIFVVLRRAIFIDIRQLKVYDPKADGLDYKAYMGLLRKMEEINFNVAVTFNEGLYERVAKSVIGYRATLRDFLYGKRLKYFFDRFDEFF